MAETSGFTAEHVYPWWLRINPTSQHKAAFQTPPSFHDEWLHVEFSTARGIVPACQKFSTTVNVDGQRVALDGHDFGPLVHHVCFPPDNALLALSWLSSKCKWPVTASRRRIEGAAPCAFMQLLVPYVYCRERAGTSSKSASADAGVKDPLLRLSATMRDKLGGVQQSLPHTLPGIGLIMVPTGPRTVLLPLRFWDMVLGIVRVLIEMAVDAALKQITFVDSDKDIKGLSLDAAMREAALDTACQDFIKNLHAEGQVSMPFQTAKFDLKTGKLTIWHKEVGDAGWKLADSGVGYGGYDDALSRLTPPTKAQGSAVIDELFAGVPHVS